MDPRSADGEPDRSATGLRKVIHVDMDAFFASVEQRDNPDLRGKPVAVGGSSGRGVVAAASYEARKFGVRSAMPSARAIVLCPDLIFCRPRFDVYRSVSQQIRAIFLDYTPHVEPLSLDEAYLDVTDDVRGIGSATRIAELIRRRIKADTGLTASAGVSYNKFLAKIASDQNKPDGMCVIRPGEGAQFVASLPVRRFHGIGPRGAEKMAALGIETGADLRARDLPFLRQHFGSLADYLYRAVRGIDLRQVKADRPRKSVGAERTFERDISSGPALRETLERILEIVWDRIERSGASGRTVTLKMKFNDFTPITRARSLPRPIADKEEFARLSRELLDAQLPLAKPIRLMGLTLSALEGEEPEEAEDGPSGAALQAELPF
ncbi:DNA-directed DNA polymerase [Novosphingobium aromaticivorans DSM 12444]|uniref:DNA polymerase IV n=1 Tax=Novosphingobium aromaticivorans (strain ATCC 700278 / DSM 12444 / CCUG 56034 / CIP 105152 / NBRC 16084 / F199) TaxID=279238 RepID=Q2G4Y1_NOVAD|nr:DNA polymerase IV [Novosphingobium aromaticivorans]ABD27092.1 DNA-directed DNA polymerase [Novosphingobium aromaticivorans DSM 12444]SCY88604.1 DNA polymerase-4 [Novosphingobium aromaticivorans]